MKLIIFVCFLFCFGRVLTQDTDEGVGTESPPVTETKLPECFVGATIYNGTDLVVEEIEQTCAQSETTCQTKVEVSPTGYRIYKECKTPEACEVNTRNNPQLCESGEAEDKGEKVCHYCCQGDFCNTMDAIPITLATP